MLETYSLEMNMLSLQSTKWAATAFIIAATIFRSLSLHTFDLVFGLVGTLMWAYCAWKMEDKPLLLVNGFCGIVLILGLIFS